MFVSTLVSQENNGGRNATDSQENPASKSAEENVSQTHRLEEKVRTEGSAPQSVWERESLFLETITEGTVADHGFTPSVVWAGEQWSNVGGGIERGTMWNSLFDIGFEQNLSKLAKIDNLGRIGMNFFYYAQSKDFGEYLSNMNPVSSNMSGEMTRVFEIYYANEFETSCGVFSFRVGQLAADEDFMGSTYSDAFLNSSFGAIPAVAGTSLASGANAFSQYALATLGVCVYYTHENFDVILGLYNGNAGEDLPGNHGFDYELEGMSFWYQLGYNYQLSNLNGRVAFGGNYHSGEFVNYESGLLDRNFYSFYLNLQQDIFANEDGTPILGAFTRLAYAPDANISVVRYYVDAGINWFAPLPDREDDVFALGFSYSRYSNPYKDASGENAKEFCIETNYKIQLTKFMSLQPSFQVFFNPTSDTGENETAYVVGGRLEVTF